MSQEKLDILVVEGTVREGRKSIKAARYATHKLKERGHEAELFDLSEKEIPMLKHTRYSDNDKHPEDVEEYGQKVEAADGLIYVCPEYNHSIPGALKNLIDYLYPEYNGKPFSFVTVSGGSFGGVRGISHMHDIALGVGANVGPDIPVSKVGQVFNEDSELVDEEYRERFEDFLDKVEEHTSKFI